MMGAENYISVSSQKSQQNQSSPLFDIVTPSFNQSTFLQENIDSVASQEISLKHIIIDGGSTDNSLDILKRNSHHLDYWCSEPDRGQSNAVNKGLERASSPFIGWLNSDDYYMPHALHLVHSTFSNHKDIAVVHGSTMLVNSSSVSLGIDRGQQASLSLRYYAGMCFPQPSSFIRRYYLEKVGLINESLHYAMDYELMLRIRLLGGNFIKIPNVLSAYRLHENSKTVSNPLGFAEEWIQVYNNFIHDESGRQPVLSVLHRLGLYRHQKASYDRSNCLTDDSLLRTLFYALHYQAYFRYQARQYAHVRLIIAAMISILPFSRLSMPLVRMWVASLLKSSL